MLKKEAIWREILFQARQNKKTRFTQKELAEKFGFSVSTVFNALKIPRTAHAINVTGRFFVLEDYRKLLYLWASERNFKKEIIYSSFLNGNTKELEAIMPPSVVFGFFSGFSILRSGSPAEYDHIYIYADQKNLEKILERVLKYESKSSNKNFFVLKPDPRMSQYPAPLFEQIFVDLWNAPEWYAKDFLKELEKEIQ